MARAERVRTAVSARPARADVGDVAVTISIGVAFDPPGRLRPIEGLLAAADRALYRAKQSGRDRVACDHEPPLTAVEMPTRDDPPRTISASMVPTPDGVFS